MCLGFVAIFSWTIGTYSLTAPLLTRVDHLIDRLSADKSTLPLIQNLSEESSPEKRMALAQLIYIGSGIAVPYQTEDGTYVVFQPAAKDRDLWRQAQSAEAKIES